MLIYYYSTGPTPRSTTPTGATTDEVCNVTNIKKWTEGCEEGREHEDIGALDIGPGSLLQAL